MPNHRDHLAPTQSTMLRTTGLYGRVHSKRQENTQGAGAWRTAPAEGPPRSGARADLVRPPLQIRPLDGVRRELQGPPVGGDRLLSSSQASEQVGSGRVQ